MPVAKGETIDPERTRRKLIDAATDLFYLPGPTVGVNELADHAAVSKLSLYRHFGSKEGLLDEVLRQRSDRVIHWLRASTAESTDPLERPLATPRGPARRMARAHLRRHRALLTALAADAGVPDPALAGRQLLILLEGATIVAALTRDPSAATDAGRLARILLLADGPRE